MVLGVVTVPAIMQLRRQGGRVAAVVEELRGEVAGLAQEANATFARVGALSDRIGQAKREVETMTTTLRGCTVRVEQIVGQVRAAEASPPIAEVSAIGMARAGLAAMMTVLWRGRCSALPDDQTEGGD